MALSSRPLPRQGDGVVEASGVKENSLCRLDFVGVMSGGVRVGVMSGGVCVRVKEKGVYALDSSGVLGVFVM